MPELCRVTYLMNRAPLTAAEEPPPPGGSEWLLNDASTPWHLNDGTTAWELNS